jgi:MFS superfamily sulfate permease-like transporter
VTIKTDYNRCIIAQGVGNTLSGLVGGLPITGVIVRSAANVNAGATSRLSAILHGIWILGFVVLAPGVLSLIPIPSLAAILVLTGLKLMDIAAIRNLSKFGRENVLIYFVTLLTIFCTDLLIGVIAGIVLSAIMVLYRLSNLHVNTETTDSIARMNMHGGATFLCLPLLAKELEVIPPGAELHIDLSHLDFIDHACLELLMNWQKKHESSGGKLYIDWGRLTAQLKRNRTGKAAEPMDEAILFAGNSGH